MKQIAANFELQLEFDKYNILLWQLCSCSSQRSITGQLQLAARPDRRAAVTFDCV